jgi:hypothetical protein
MALRLSPSVLGSPVPPTPCSNAERLARCRHNAHYRQCAPRSRGIVAVVCVGRLDPPQGALQWP